MVREPVMLDSARKRGYADDDLLHAVAHPLYRFHQEDGMTMHIGPDGTGVLMEVGTIVLRDGRTAIAHAMRPPRPKFLPTTTATR
jgi:hypothetical protein